MPTRLVALAAAPVEFAEAEVAVGYERTHAKLLRQLHRLAVMAFNYLYVGRIRAGGNLGQETEGVSLETTLPTLARE